MTNIHSIGFLKGRKGEQDVAWFSLIMVPLFEISDHGQKLK